MPSGTGGRWHLSHTRRDTDGQPTFPEVWAQVADKIKGLKLPKDFNATEYFATKFGVVIGYDVKPERIVIRANEDHKYYLKFTSTSS